MKKHLFLIVSLALGMAACTNDVLTPEDNQENNTPNQQTPASTLQTAKLTSFNSSQNRVTVYPETRYTKAGSIELIATIDNLSKETGRISGFVKEEGGRYLSATSVYYDQPNSTYYVTYHMQGNNYNTDQANETGGFLESFTLEEKDGSLVPNVGSVYMASNPENLSFDFNHLYFDQIPNVSEITFTGMVMDYVGDYTVDDFKGNRIIAVGHSSTPVKEGTGFNTKAIIGRLNLNGSNPTFDYQEIYTGDKLYDEGITNNDGSLASLGKEDARDANCVVRKYNHYYVATRKGIAVVKAGEDNIFEQETDSEGSIYFIKTPGSAKYLSQPTFTSGVNVLFLNNESPETGITANTTSPATLAEFGIDTRDGKDFPQDISKIKDFSWSNLTTSTSPNKILFENIESVSPVDGKNVLFTTRNITCAALGKGGLFVNYPSYINKQIKTFTDAKDGSGSRPVNGVFVEELETYQGKTSHNGFIYVANGACLTIIDAQTLETVAEYSAFKEGDASANFVHVKKLDTLTNGETSDRIVTVAYGQAGVKVFKFVPPVR